MGRPERSGAPAVVAALVALAALAVAPAATSGQEPGGGAGAVTAERLGALFPDSLGELARTSLRTGYRAERFPYAEAEYGEGSEGPVGTGGRTGAGVSLQAGLVPPGAPDPANGLRHMGGEARDTTYAGHRAYRIRMPAGGSGAMVVLEGPPRAVVTVVCQGEVAPSPLAVLEAFGVERLADLAAELEGP